MRIKSFFSDSIEEALHQARKEFGDEALLLKSGISASSFQDAGVYEVVVGLEDQPHREASPDLMQHLLNQGIQESLAVKIIGSFSDSLVSEQEIRNAISAHLILDCPPIGQESVVSFIGPPGHGKTLSLIKLAIHSLIASGKTPFIISGASHQAGASARLSAIAEIVGFQYQLIDQPELLSEIISSHTGTSILIDTPGFSEFESSEFIRWSRAIRQIPGGQSHLVLSSTNQFNYLRETITRYLPFQYTHLLFTRIDEIETTGEIISLAAFAQTPLSWLGQGQSEHSDLKEATASDLLQRLFSPARFNQRALAASGAQ